MIVAAIDPGIKNFAISVESIETETFSSLVRGGDIQSALLCAETLFVDVQHITTPDPIHGITDLLKTYSWIWETCDVVLIERQMQFKGIVNHACLRVSHHCMSYLYLMYPRVKVVEYQSSNKTRVLDAPVGMTKPQRKKWSVATVTKILADRGDVATLGKFTGLSDTGQKLDDICDCILMCLTYTIMVSKRKR
jgi:hypothetical protein